jgi:hypothetical protein
MLKRNTKTEKTVIPVDLKKEIISDSQKEINKKKEKEQEEKEFDFINYYINRYSMFLS